MEIIRNALKKDYPDILKLNQEDVEMLSPLDEKILFSMDELSEIFNVFEIDGEIAGFLIAFSKGSRYWSDNYLWFSDNYDNFIYIDRIVIGKNYRKRGIAGKLYENIFSHALKNGFSIACAEIDIEPEYNHQSISFHKKMGFNEVGRRLSKQKVTVSLQIKEIK